MDSRVVFTFEETAPIGCLRIAFNKEVFPAFGAPIKATLRRRASDGCGIGACVGMKILALVGTGDLMYDAELNRGELEGEKNRDSDSDDFVNLSISRRSSRATGRMRLYLSMIERRVLFVLNMILMHKKIAIKIIDILALIFAIREDY